MEVKVIKFHRIRQKCVFFNPGAEGAESSFKTIGAHYKHYK